MPPTAILDKFDGLRPSGQDKWQAKCPSHDDNTASLSIGMGNDGKLLLHCHAGCKTEDILAAKGLSFGDLAGDSRLPPTQPTEYRYHDRDGTHVYTVVRGRDKKFMHKRADGIWSMKGVQRLPYNLPAAMEADTVFIVEGEKDVETLRRAGLVGTCNSGGAGKWLAEFADYFTGKTVYILPDNDEPGVKHAQDVQAKLGHGSIVELPGLPAKGDVSDWFAGGKGKSDLLDLVAETLKSGPSLDTTPLTSGKKGVSSQPVQSDSEKSALPELNEFVSFPTDSLPECLAEYVRQGARAMCCDESFIAMPLLAGLASAIGNSQGLRIKRGWVVPSILWSVVIAESGSGKSAPQRLAIRPIHAMQRRLLKEYDEAYSEYEKQNEIYQRELAEFKKSKGEIQEPPEQPEEPVCKRLVVNDTTIEALGKRLSDNPRGVLCASDELSGWFGSFSRYSRGKSGGDESKWLEFFGAQMSVIDRASGRKPLIIDKASVSVTGTIQPGTLRNQLTAEHKASGLAARLLFAMPPRRRREWTESEVDESAEQAVEDVFSKLFSLEMRYDEDEQPQTNLVRLSGEAKSLFVRYYNRHNKEQQSLNGDLYAAYSKLEEYAARLALVLHCVCHAAEGTPLAEMNVNSMAMGIELCEWFKAEAKRVYAVLAESEETSISRQQVEWIRAQEQPPTAREFYRAHRSHFDLPEDAERRLSVFAKAEIGEWRDSPPGKAGGRPTQRFHLQSFGHNPQNPWENRGSVQAELELPPGAQVLEGLS